MMDYRYAGAYGSHTVEKQYDKGERKYYTFQQDKVDASVDKALLQGMKEDRMPFKKLLAVLRKETAQHMHADDRYRNSAAEQLHKYQGYRGGVDYPLLQSDLAGYWKRQLLDAHGHVV